MTKIFKLLIAMTLIITLAGCSSGRSPEEIGEYYVECVKECKAIEFMSEYTGDLYFKLNAAGMFETREEFLAHVERQNQEIAELRARYNQSYEFLESKIIYEFTKEELKRYNETYDTNFKDMVLVKVRFNELTNGKVDKEEDQGLLLLKKNGKWEMTRFMSTYQYEYQSNQ